MGDVKIRMSGLEEALEQLQRQIHEFTRKYHNRRVPLSDAATFIAGLKTELTGLSLTRREEAEDVGNQAGLEFMEAAVAELDATGPYNPDELGERWEEIERTISGLPFLPGVKSELKKKAWAVLISPFERKDPDLWWMVKIIYAEAAGEPYEGKLAVGWVVRNRLEMNDPKWWGSGSYQAIVTHSSPVAPVQFLGILNNQWRKVEGEAYKDMPSEDDKKDLMSSIKAAYGVHGGRTADPSHGAEFFNKAGKPEDWIVRYANHKPPKAIKTATIGKHEFWRLTDYYWSGRTNWPGPLKGRKKRFPPDRPVKLH